MIFSRLTSSGARRVLHPRLKPYTVARRGKTKIVVSNSLRERPPCWHRPANICEICLPSPQPQKCFNIKNVQIVEGDSYQIDTVRDFLNAHYWPREPSVNALYMPLNCEYIQTLTNKYATLGDKYMAYEDGERLIGVCIGIKYVYCSAQDFWQWSRFDPTGSPMRNHKCFLGHCFGYANLFGKYNTAYIYDLSVIATTPDVQGQGVATLLLQRGLDAAKTLTHPIHQVIATNAYVQRICRRLNLEAHFTLPYKDYLDHIGNQVFFVRRPHTSVVVYARYLTNDLLTQQPCLPPL